MLRERRAVKKNFRTTKSLNEAIKKLLSSDQYKGYSEGDLINLALENLVDSTKLHMANKTSGGKKMKPELQYEDVDGLIIVESTHLIQKISRIVKAVDLAYAVDKPLYVMHPEVLRTKAGEEALRLLLTYAVNKDIMLGLDGIEPATDKQHKKFLKGLDSNNTGMPSWTGHIIEREKQRIMKKPKQEQQ